jgi:hypothetical protein
MVQGPRNLQTQQDAWFKNTTRDVKEIVYEDGGMWCDFGVDASFRDELLFPKFWTLIYFAFQYIRISLEHCLTWPRSMLLFPLIMITFVM